MIAGKSLRLAREKAGYTLLDVERLAGYMFGYRLPSELLEKWENERWDDSGYPTREQLRLLAAIYDCPVAAFSAEMLDFPQAEADL
jgi:transcriptional regulator with XRE-family HTH domain